MLKQLSITNYALIDHIEVCFNKGLTIITGETGAGKSILLGALGLILGERADSSVMRDTDKKCIVEGLFDIAPYELAGFFESNELDHEPTTSLRREIAPGGKSRAFINDTPVNLSTLKELAEKLIDIHSQHETILLNNQDFQLNILDVYGNCQPLKTEYQGQHREYLRLRSEKAALEEKQAAELLNQSFMEFQYNELEAAKLDNDNELREIEAELNVLANLELIKQGLGQTWEVLDNSEFNIIQQLSLARTSLQKAAAYDPRIQEKLSRIEAALVELKDLANDCRLLDDSLEFNQERMAELSQRSDLLNRLIVKHRVTGIAELKALRDETGAKLADISNADAALAALEEKINSIGNSLFENARKLSADRKEACGLVCGKVNQLLGLLGMPFAELQVSLESGDRLKPTGIDEVKFLVRTNKGTQFQPIDRIASGGELSRIMLCLKSINAEKNIMPTIIFDEIDTGISGEVASKMGDVLRQLGSRMQVISISHLPQIAGKGDAHLKVSKRIDGAGTFSQIEVLGYEERVKEIAAMISGAEITTAAMENARILLST